jgi:hypothetical protein
MLFWILAMATSSTAIRQFNLVVSRVRYSAEASASGRLGLSFLLLSIGEVGGVVEDREHASCQELAPHEEPLAWQGRRGTPRSHGEQSAQPSCGCDAERLTVATQSRERDGSARTFASSADQRPSRACV